MLSIMEGLRTDGYHPIYVYNSNAYDRQQTIRLLDSHIDVFLPDLKYMDDKLARGLSGTPGYVTAATVALREMYRVLRPGGRAVVSLGRKEDDPKRPGSTDALGIWLWSETEARYLLEQAGFTGVTVSYGRWSGEGEARLVRGIKAD